MQPHRRIKGFTHRDPAVSVDELLQVLLPDPYANFPILDTPYSKYISTTYVASEQDLHAITEIHHQHQAQLKGVAAEIAFVESVLKRVQDVHQQFLDKHAEILASMKAHQGLVSRIRCLPTEILSEIFVQCLPPERYIEPDTRTAPIVLLSVCREWRTVALGTPRLWCSLSVRLSSQGKQKDVSIYKPWLSRARGCSLSLAVDARFSSQNLMQRQQVLEPLLPYTFRAVRLHVMFDEVTTPNVLLNNVPALEDLTLEGDLRKVTKITVAQPQPRLRSLALTKVMFRAGPTALSVLDIGWTHLTQLRVRLRSMPVPGRDMDGLIVLTLLTLCPHLQDLTLSPVFILHPNATMPRAITHTHLHSLDVFVLHGVSYLLDALTLPALRHLKISDSYVTHSAWQRNEFKTFVERSQCSLETLVIRSGESMVTQEDRAEYTALIPTLKRLDLCLMDGGGVVESPTDALRRLGLSE